MIHTVLSCTTWASFFFVSTKWLKHSRRVYHGAAVFLLCCCLLTRQQDVSWINGSVIEFLFQAFENTSHSLQYLFNPKTPWCYLFYHYFNYNCRFRAPRSSTQKQPSQAEHVGTFSACFNHKSKAEVRLCVKLKLVCANAEETMQK